MINYFTFPYFVKLTCLGLDSNPGPTGWTVLSLGSSLDPFPAILGERMLTKNVSVTGE